jgi:hypothetical protein
MNFRLCFTGHAESAYGRAQKPLWGYLPATPYANAELTEIDALDCLPDLPELLALPPPDGQFHTPVMFRSRLIDDIRQVARFILYSNGCPAGRTLKIFHLQDEQTSDVFQNLAFDHPYPPSLTFRSGCHALPA